MPENERNLGNEFGLFKLLGAGLPIKKATTMAKYRPKILVDVKAKACCRFRTMAKKILIWKGGEQYIKSNIEIRVLKTKHRENS